MKKYIETIKSLSDLKNYRSLYHKSRCNSPMPSILELTELMELLKAVLFPGFWGYSDIREDNIIYNIGASLQKIEKILNEQIKCGICFECDNEEMQTQSCEYNVTGITEKFIKYLPKIKELLSKDVIAAYNGDPAAKSYGETIFCYLSILALTHHRIAHELLNLGIALIPRIISEMAHSKTGIEIHPGAKIGEYFFIDHGTGVVIGETTIIGNNVRIYQGVTLGAKSFPLDENGKPIKGIPRHPIIEDNVIIYSNSTILGRIVIGQNSIIGGNQWVTEDVLPNTKLFKK